jgi:rubredoxin
MRHNKKEEGKVNIYEEEVFMKYTCSVCGYVYDESSEGVPFDQLPEDWSCPICGADKSQFTKDG